ncbi:MAG: hypothetical protein JWM27_3572 [Gemmatimonadetes bacterium]|nr:hypothetical protein [Gemmatimonadota bacterium]
MARAVAATAGAQRTPADVSRIFSVVTLLIAAFGLLIVYAARETAGAVGLTLSAAGMANVGQVLAPVVLLSLFIERATEVVISSWRDPEAQNLQHLVDAATGDGRVDAQRALDFYRLETQRLAFAMSFTLSVLTALVGLRAIEPLMAQGVVESLTKTHPSQQLWFHRIDIVITALLMAGGADGMHQIVTTFSSFLSSTKDRAASPAAAPPTGAGGAAVPSQTQAPMPAASVHQNLATQAAVAAGQAPISNAAANAQAQQAAPAVVAPAAAPAPVQPVAPAPGQPGYIDPNTAVG